MSETTIIREWLAARELTNDPAVAAKGVVELGIELKSSAAAASVTPRLDERHKAILRELLKRPSWQLTELRALTSRAGLMPLACVATLNEWATDTFGDLIIEGEKILNLNENLKRKLQL